MPCQVRAASWSAGVSSGPSRPRESARTKAPDPSRLCLRDGTVMRDEARHRLSESKELTALGPGIHSASG